MSLKTSINPLSKSKILWTAGITFAVNLGVSTGIIPESLGPQTIEFVNTTAFGLIALFRAFGTAPK